VLNLDLVCDSQLLKKGSCKKPTPDQVSVPGAKMVLKMYGKGFR